MDCETRIINRLSAVGILGNILLSVFKFIAGILGNSSAMVSDAFHSMSDVAATVVAYFGAKVGRKDNDHEHPYGHERYECVSSIILGAILLVTGVVIGIEAFMKIDSGDYTDEPEMIAMVAAVVSIIVKELMFRYTMHYANILDSDSFRSDAWHHRSDVISSLASLVGIGLAMLGYPIMDPIASIIICLFIIKMGYDIIKDAFNKMVDTACDDGTLNCMCDTVNRIEGVQRIDSMNTRRFGNRIYVDLEITVDGDIPVREGHRIAEKVHLTLEEKYPAVKHVMVHVNPSGDEPPKE